MHNLIFVCFNVNIGVQLRLTNLWNHVLATEDKGAKKEATNSSSPWVNSVQTVRSTWRDIHCKDIDECHFRHDLAIQVDTVCKDYVQGDCKDIHNCQLNHIKGDECADIGCVGARRTASSAESRSGTITWTPKNSFPVNTGSPPSQQTVTQRPTTPVLVRTRPKQ